MKVKLINKSNNPTPHYATEGSAGFDLRANLGEDINTTKILPGHRKLIPTGLYMELPKGLELQIRPRSGLTLKKGLTILNSPGTIDSDYRGEISIILINHGTEPVTIEQGERIGQGVMKHYIKAELVEVDLLEETTRGDGGFGHTGRG